MTVRDEIKKLATQAVAMGWCEPEASGREMAPVLAAEIAKPVPVHRDSMVVGRIKSGHKSALFLIAWFVDTRAL